MHFHEQYNAINRASEAEVVAAEFQTNTLAHAELLGGKCSSVAVCVWGYRTMAKESENCAVQTEQWRLLDAGSKTQSFSTPSLDLQPLIFTAGLCTFSQASTEKRRTEPRVKHSEAGRDSAGTTAVRPDGDTQL